MNRWLRSLSMRIALLNAVLVAIFCGGLIILVAMLTPRFMVDNLDETVMDELHFLVRTFEVEGREGLVSMLRQRINANVDDHRMYVLADPQGHKIIGNLEAWPALTEATISGWVVPISHGETGRMRVRAHSQQLSDGNWLLVGFDEHRIDYMRKSMHQGAALGLLATIVLAAIVGYLTSRVPLRHVDTINRTAERIIAGDLSQRVPTQGGLDELDRLGLTLNRMLDRISSLMQAVGSATDNIAHDLRTPLARLKTRIESAQATAVGASAELLDELSGDVDRVLSVFSSLLHLTTIENGLQRSAFQPVAIAPLIDDAVQTYEAVAAGRGILISESPGDAHHDSGRAAGPYVLGDRNLLFQALCNLLDNAVKYSPDGSRISVGVSESADTVQIAMVDEGPGIPAPERERVFDRLVRLDASRSTPGSGLGLSVVRAIARLHGGECRILPSNQGTRIVLVLPSAV